jgi:hypothetical protein
MSDSAITSKVIPSYMMMTIAFTSTADDPMPSASCLDFALSGHDRAQNIESDSITVCDLSLDVTNLIDVLK